LTIEGYKSIETIEDFKPRQLNVLIGPNGAGKSNFISFFKFLSRMLDSDGRLQEYVAYLGGANDILFDGVDKTNTIHAHIQIETHAGVNEYAFGLGFAKPDRLVFKEERYRYSNFDKATSPAVWTDCGSAHEEARLPESTGKTATTILSLLRRLVVYQFHNTGDTSPMRLKWSISDGKYLKQNGDNLGSFLYKLQIEQRDYYYRIVRYIRSVLPFFDDFELYDDFGQVLLRWKEKGTSKIFNAGQASDGMLRIIALISLLGQNPRDLPSVIFLDEPELGLHPAAIDVVAGLIKSVSEYCQVFVATQSVSLVNNFAIDDLVVISRTGRSSRYTRPNPEELNLYLEEFSTGEIWEKNIIGGRP
jgi:predicted ATPase